MTSQLKETFDVPNIKKIITKINKDINTMISQGITKQFDFELKIMEDYPDFYQEHPFLVKKLCKRDNIAMLYKMFSKLEDIENGEERLENVEYTLGQQLANEFLYPVVNNKKK
jgi:hypothetical protein